MKKKRYISVSEATRKLEHYCAYQERCHKEVRTKLKAMDMGQKATDHIMAHLINGNFLNEERFAQGFARGKFRIKKWGKKRIEKELKFRDISSFNIKSALKTIDDNEYLETLDALAHKKNREIRDANLQKRRKKLADYLLYRGWESHLVYEKITELTKAKGRN